MSKPLLEFERGEAINPLQQWKEFRKNFMSILLEKNRDVFNWESPDYAPGAVIDIRLIMDWFDDSFANDLAAVKVYPFKRDGLRFDFEFQTMDPKVPFKNQLRIIRACHDGFYRDWKHDGICVKKSYEEESYPPSGDDYYEIY